ELHGPIEGLACPGFVAGASCCRALPAQRAHAWLQHTLQHHREQLSSLESVVSGVAEAFHADGECAALREELLQTRLAVARFVAAQASEGQAMVEHLVTSGLCAYCFRQDEASEYSMASQDGPSERALAMLAVGLQGAHQGLLDNDWDVLRRDPGRKCVPEYLATFQEGCSVGGRVAHTLLGHGRSVLEAASADGGTAEAVRASVHAIARLRRWGLERRLLSPEFAEEAAESFHEDFQEAADRLLTFLMSPAARLMHQLQILALSMDYRRSSDSPAAGLLWNPFALPGPAPAQDPAPPPRAAAAAGGADPGAAFGTVVLISNRTAEDTVDRLLELLAGPRVLFLEDVCGAALEALGYGCHSGGAAQARCLRPSHATRILRTVAPRDAEQRPHAAWRRHAATRTVAHTAWALAAAAWGPGCEAWLMDLRADDGSACGGAAPLAEAAASVPGARLRVVRDAAAFLGLPTAGGRPSEGAAPPAAARGGEPQESAAAAGAAFADGVPLATRLAAYADFHQRGVELMSNGSTDVPVLVYSCQPFAQCGGHGDRLNGIVTAFFLAVLTRRVFLLDSESPVPLQLLLEPRALDWRVRGGTPVTAALRHLSYHDKRRQFQADIERLAAYPDNMLVISMNYRMIRSLFEAPALRGAAEELALPASAPPFLVAEVFDTLFAQSPALMQEMRRLRAALGGLEDRRFVAVHLRTGDVAWDPARHGAEELEHFLGCARAAEAELGLPGGLETPWLLATDSAEVAARAAETPEGISGKLRIPPSVGRVHIERSDLAGTLEGAGPNLAEWLLFGRAAAAVLSRSYFGETAAEVGRVPAAYFAPGGACVRTDLSSS
ncbi:unnamed protein product, partial [Prorocentrum cordatum]